MELITTAESCVILGLRRRGNLSIEGIGATMSTRTRGQATLRLRSHCDRTFELQFNAYLLRSIASTTPTTYIDVDSWVHLRDLELADPTFGTPGGIDVLLGADIWGMILQDGIVTGADNEPCAMRTRLGWVVFGPATANTPISSLHTLRAVTCMRDQRLDELLRRFWELEEPEGPADKPMDICEEIFESTVSRQADGRYVVQIPFRPNASVLGTSYASALRQFLHLERKLMGNPGVRDKYIEFMREYSALGHMAAIPDQRVDPRQSYYIPHHAVTAKFRVVFNASAKTTTGVSLNDTQLSGPQLQDALVDIILRFRRSAIAITADIEKMFRQVLVDPRHWNWQLILWRESPSEPVRTYALKTVTYGMASGPYNAIRALRQCAVDNEHVVQDVSRAAAARSSILSNFYVDDFLDSADNQGLATTLAKDIDTILQEGKFKLRKWNSNCKQTLAAITGSGASASELNLSDSDTTVLGLHWNPIQDELFYRIEPRYANAVQTKRTVLSEVAHLYDPTGALSPVIIVAKIFIQTLWKAGLEWDAELPMELQEQWLTFRNGLAALAQIRVPRWLGVRQAATITLHGFCDASSRAYAAVIYVRSVDEDGHSSVGLVRAKTKVAPVKAATIPRLELCAAHLLTVTLNSVKQALRLHNVKYTLYSDSTIVLCWLRRPASTWKQYVSNRISFIQENSDSSCWRHIRTELNPADCASRGIAPAALEHHQLWWKGPPCIESDEDIGELPAMTCNERHSFDVETKPIKVLIGATAASKLMTSCVDGRRIPLVDRFSKLSSLLNTTARVRRFQPAHRVTRADPVITPAEREREILWHIREAQSKAFTNDLNRLASHSSVDASSSLLTLAPFLDGGHILRVGGRLNNAHLTYDRRHPIIIPRDSTLASLLIAEAHEICLHGGIQEMLGFLRQRFWIIHSRVLVKSWVHRCAVCRRHQRTLQRQQMAALPRSRVTVAPPFSNSGLDYCGPFNVRIGGKRSNTTTKTYGVIFVCMASRAVHIELAEDLSTRAFLDVFDRFVSRRGYCANLFSDNGTQFVGADRVLRQDLREWNNDHAQQHVASAGVNWRFIVPAAPHHGGLWEAAVRSAKKHLLKVAGRTSLRYHELSTLLIKIEACLNSRPIVALHDAPDGGTALTPGDFLVGRPLTSRPERSLPDAPANRLKHWQRLQQMYEHFWTRWQDEYLSTLQARGKWARPEPNLAIDDVVVIMHENLPPSRWRIGRVVEVHPGSDGLVRVVTIEYNSERLGPDGLFVKHTCKRAVQKVVRLTGASDDIPNLDGSAGQEC